MKDQLIVIFGVALVLYAAIIVKQDAEIAGYQRALDQIAVDMHINYELCKE